MAIYEKGDIIAKVNGSKIPKAGVKFLDKDGNETGLSLFNCLVQDDTLILAPTKNSTIAYKADENMRNVLDRNKDNMNDILSAARSISINFHKTLVVHGDIAEKSNIMNYVKFNDLSVPMTSEEINKLFETTGNKAVIDSNKIDFNSPSSYGGIFYRFDNLFIPQKTPMIFSEDDKLSNDHSFVLENDNNDYSEVDMSNVNNSEIVIYQKNHKDKILPPKISPEQEIKITSLTREKIRKINRDDISEFLDNDVRFKYHFNDSPFNGNHTSSVRNYVENYINSENWGVREDNFHRITEFISILDELESKNIDPKEAFPDIKSKSEFKFIYDNKDEIAKHELIKERLDNVKKLDVEPKS